MFLYGIVCSTLAYFCRVKALCILFFIALLSASSVVKFTQVVNFAVNQQRIAKELCVERNQENSCCAGKCQLVKSVQMLENKVPDPVQGIKVVKTFDPTYLLPETSSITFIDLGISQVNEFGKAFTEALFAKEIFHPPIS